MSTYLQLLSGALVGLYAFSALISVDILFQLGNSPPVQKFGFLNSDF